MTSPNAPTRRITLYGVTAEVVAPCSLDPTLAIVLAAYPPAARGAVPDIRIAAVHDDEGDARWRIVADERSYPEVDDPGTAARRVEWLVVSEALKRWTRFVHVHAALVATPAQSALLVGRSGSGKSTTSVALAQAGLALYTDDVALVDRATLRPLSMPRPIKLDDRARRLLRARGVVVPRGSRLGESVDRTVLPGLPPIGQPGPPLGTAIFFAEERQRRVAVRPLTRAEAMMRLILQSASERFDAAGPSAGALDLVNAVRCYELVAADLDATVRAVLDLLGVADAAATAVPAVRPRAALGST